MNMIEKVAMTIQNCPYPATNIDKAKAAIAAMREPNKEMLEEVSPHTDDWVERYWKPAIDAALKEK